MMPRALKARLAGLGRRLRREDGTATVEFVIILPVLMTIFMSSCEAGVLAIRSVMLERALDMTIRELRLNKIPDPTSAKLKQEICRLSMFIPDCLNSLTLELAPVDKTNWTALSPQSTCIDRSADLNSQQPPNFNPGGSDELMMVRACAVVDLIFPGSGLGLDLPKDSTGGYHLLAMSAFVNEPS